MVPHRPGTLCESELNSTRTSNKRDHFYKQETGAELKHQNSQNQLFSKHKCQQSSDIINITK